MKPVFKKIRQLAKPYLDTRHNDVHTDISTQLAFELLEREGGDEDIVIPAIILHDTGWKKVPAKLQLKAFGPKASKPELNRLHEVEGVKIAEDILSKLNYDAGKSKCIVEIIDGHDSRLKPLSLYDMIVKDADKLWRYSKSGFYIDIQNIYNKKANQPANLVQVKDDNGAPIVINPEAPVEEQRYLLKELTTTSGTILPTIGLMIEF